MVSVLCVCECVALEFMYVSMCINVLQLYAYLGMLHLCGLDLKLVCVCVHVRDWV